MGSDSFQGGEPGKRGAGYRQKAGERSRNRDGLGETLNKCFRRDRQERLEGGKQAGNGCSSGLLGGFPACFPPSGRSRRSGQKHLPGISRDVIVENPVGVLGQSGTVSVRARGQGVDFALDERRRRRTAGRAQSSRCSRILRIVCGASMKATTSSQPPHSGQTRRAPFAPTAGGLLPSPLSAAPAEIPERR